MTPPRRELLAWMLALLVGVGVWCASCLLEAPKYVPFNFGTTFAAMAQDPFACRGLFPHRLLGPLLAHLLGVDSGERFAWFSHATSMLFLATVFALARQRGADVLAALLVTVAIAGTSAVTVYKSHVGYMDSLTFALSALMLLAVRSAPWFYGLLLLDLLNHEQVFFVLPWLLWQRRLAAPGPWWRELAWLLAALVPYGVFRWWVGTQAPPDPALLTTAYYAHNHYFWRGTLGLSLLAVIDSVIFFGPLPAAFWWWSRARARRGEGWGLVLFAVSILGIFLVAHDVYRFVSLQSLPLVPVLAAFAMRRRDAAWRVGCVLLVAASVAAVQWQNDRVFPTFVVAMFGPGSCGVWEDPTKAVLLTCLVPRLWHLYAIYGAVAAALVAAGAWLGARDARAGAGSALVGAGRAE